MHSPCDGTGMSPRKLGSIFVRPSAAAWQSSDSRRSAFKDRNFLQRIRGFPKYAHRECTHARREKPFGVPCTLAQSLPVDDAVPGGAEYQPVGFYFLNAAIF
ncbi:hypothetical protein FJ930_04370 [Mesorhizobium sp. B2-4-15]|uniref:hypothetical protein n=1 Tax=Mesorhizobium sp. B2-4-15 TaxID=2589934 RepID=UPI00114FB279|nr:hypothetical protein [Mesorhizobium sp. B2-4-15]TPK75338.1 hypothetical protein FJ930_04370 [Mesorhizobium sp. B2-4-15]